MNPISTGLADRVTGLIPLLVVLGLMGVTGCRSSGDPTRRMPTRDLPTIIVDQSDNGSQVGLVPGQKMTLLLIRNIRDGMAWSLAAPIDPEILTLSSGRTVGEQTPDGQRNPRGTEQFTFTAVGGGELTLDLAYGRLGTPPNQAVNRFLLRVVVDRFRRP